MVGDLRNIGSLQKWFKSSNNSIQNNVHFSVIHKKVELLIIDMGLSIYNPSTQDLREDDRETAWL